MRTIKDLAEQILAIGDVPDPQLIKVETQVRTGLMFPLPTWLDAGGTRSPLHRPGSPD